MKLNFQEKFNIVDNKLNNDAFKSCQICKQNSFSTIFEKEHSIRLSDGPHWQEIRESAKVRDLLLHAGGNVTLGRNGKQEYEDLVCRNKARFDIDNSRLLPKEAHLTKFVEEVADFTGWLEDQVT